LFSLFQVFTAAKGEKVWNEEEGVLDTQVLATHEEQSGQPATGPIKYKTVLIFCKEFLLRLLSFSDRLFVVLLNVKSFHDS